VLVCIDDEFITDNKIVMNNKPNKRNSNSIIKDQAFRNTMNGRSMSEE
jgi:hypothetical protein